MLQNISKTLGFQKIMVYKTPPGGGGGGGKPYLARGLLGLMSQYDLVFDFKLKVGHYDLYFMLQ